LKHLFASFLVLMARLVLVGTVLQL